MTTHPYVDALDAVWEVLAFHAPRPRYLPRSIELEHKVREAARAAVRARVALPEFSAALGRLAAEAIPMDADAATAAAWAMAAWAGREYYGAPDLDVDAEAP
jgi:hypothetical protein